MTIIITGSRKLLETTQSRVMIVRPIAYMSLNLTTYLLGDLAANMNRRGMGLKVILTHF